MADPIAGDLPPRRNHHGSPLFSSPGTEGFGPYQRAKERCAPPPQRRFPPLASGRPRHRGSRHSLAGHHPASPLGGDLLHHVPPHRTHDQRLGRPLSMTVRAHRPGDLTVPPHTDTSIPITHRTAQRVRPIFAFRPKIQKDALLRGEPLDYLPRRGGLAHHTHVVVQLIDQGEFAPGVHQFFGKFGVCVQRAQKVELVGGPRRQLAGRTQRAWHHHCSWCRRSVPPHPRRDSHHKVRILPGPSWDPGFSTVSGQRPARPGHGIGPGLMSMSGRVVINAHRGSVVHTGPSCVADYGHFLGHLRTAGPWVGFHHDHTPTPSSDTALVGVHGLLTHLTSDTDWPRQVLDMIAEQLISAGDAAKHLAHREGAPFHFETHREAEAAIRRARDYHAHLAHLDGAPSNITSELHRHADTNKMARIEVLGRYPGWAWAGRAYISAIETVQVSLPEIKVSPWQVERIGLSLRAGQSASVWVWRDRIRSIAPGGKVRNRSALRLHSSRSHCRAGARSRLHHLHFRFSGRLKAVLVLHRAIAQLVLWPGTFARVSDRCQG
ncbi:hypothetical protein BQ8420_15365 [Nocardiopsis sp. JB363]|nr:hypothetical protein BQ8420_15365 [Nocardiopsis sp. JB363]